MTSHTEPDTRTFTDGRDRFTFRASRSGVLDLVKDASVCELGWWLTAQGELAELIAAGLATTEMIEGMGKTRVECEPAPMSSATK